MKPTTTLMFGLIFVLAVTSCATAPNQPTIAPAETPASGSPSEPAAPGDNAPISLTDALGQPLEFDSPPQRLVVAGRATPLLVDTLYLFPEATDRMVGLEARFQAGVDHFYPIVDPTYDQVAKLEMNAAAEQILPLEPEVVIMKTFMAESLGQPLQEIGVPVLYLELETPQQFERDINSLGQLLDNPDRAIEINAYYAERQARVAELISSIAQAEKPRVLLAQYSEQDGQVSVEVPSAGWLQTSLVELAGGVPIWKEAAPSGGWTVIGFEQIAAWDPDKIFIINYFGDSSSAVKQLVDDPNWAALQAVQNGEIFGFPADFLSWDQPDTRWILGLQWLATKINPELAGQIDIMVEVESFYSQLYGLDQADIDAEIMPHLQGDLP